MVLRKSNPPVKSAEHAYSNAVTPSAASKKRKIDWTTIDETPLFKKGFTVKSAAFIPAKKSSKGRKNKKQKVDEAIEVEREVYKNAPMNANIVQKNPYAECELSQTHYKVLPAMVWEETQRYRKFTSKSCLAQSPAALRTACPVETPSPSNLPSHSHRCWQNTLTTYHSQ
jgi:hypothetical protein